MMTLDDLIAHLTKIRETHKGELLVGAFVDAQITTGVSVCAPPVRMTTELGVRDVVVLNITKNQD